MTLYRKRPVVVDMIQWTGDNFGEVEAFIAPTTPVRDLSGRLRLWVEKSSASLAIDIGTWIARERDGVGFYPIIDAQQADTFDRIDLEREARDLYDRSSLVNELALSWGSLDEEHRQHFRDRVTAALREECP